MNSLPCSIELARISTREFSFKDETSLNQFKKRNTNLPMISIHFIIVSVIKPRFDPLANEIAAETFCNFYCQFWAVYENEKDLLERRRNSFNNIIIIFVVGSYLIFSIKKSKNMRNFFINRKSTNLTPSWKFLVYKSLCKIIHSYTINVKTFLKYIVL